MSKNNADNLMIVGIIFFTSKVHHPPTLIELHRLQIDFCWVPGLMAQQGSHVTLHKNLSFRW